MKIEYFLLLGRRAEKWEELFLSFCSSAGRSREFLSSPGAGKTKARGKGEKKGGRMLLQKFKVLRSLDPGLMTMQEARARMCREPLLGLAVERIMELQDKLLELQQENWGLRRKLAELEEKS